MFRQPREHVICGLFAVYGAISDIKRIAVGKRADEGDDVIARGKMALTQTEVVDC